MINANLPEHLPEIAVLLGESGRDYEIANDLMRTGYVVYVCASPKEVHALLRAGKMPVVLSDSTQASAFDDSPLTRLVYAQPGAEGLPAPAGGANGIKVQIVGTGVDTELATILSTMRRHLAAPRVLPEAIPEPPMVSASWQLSSPPRRIVSPKGKSVPLTLTEWQFLSHIFTAANRTLTYQQWQDVSAKDGLRHLHNVAVLVSRLRRKSLKHGVMLPLEAMRGIGYSFTEPCLKIGPPR